MELPTPRISVSVITDEKFHERPRRDIFADVEVPEQAHGFQLGPQSLLAMATDRSDIIIASAGGHLLQHPAKQPLLYVVHAGVNPPYIDQGLEDKLVGALIKAAVTIGISGVWLCEDVAAIVTAHGGQSHSRDKGTDGA